MNSTIKHRRKAINLLLIILAGEGIFILPFVIARIFRPTFLKAFEIDNLELGYCFSAYGFIALGSYFLGGGIADRFSAKKLIATSLILTSAGGFYMMSYPSFVGMIALFSFWGFSTIFLFWAAMIRVTRIWGGSSNQGRAFGFLDGGRGLIAALIGTTGILIFIYGLPKFSIDQELGELKEAFKSVILFASIFVSCIGLLVYLFFHESKEIPYTENITSNYKSALRIKAVWLLMIIVCSAYIGYKTTDDFTLYASEVMNYNSIESAILGTSLLYMRPILGLIIGLSISKSSPSRWLIVGFIVMLFCSLIFVSGVLDAESNLGFILSISATAIGVYSARILYFMLLEEGKIPLHITGTAVGLISIIGFTPDIFFGPLTGYLLDRSPGELGHQHLFVVLTCFCLTGLIASISFRKIVRSS